MAKVFIALCALLALTYADEPYVSLTESEQAVSRLFATVTTITSTRYLTAGTCSFSTSCAFLWFNAWSPCRRRRGVNERPIILGLDDDVQPSAPLA